MFFSKARRAAVLEANPGIAFGEVGKKLGEAWKAATPEERAPFDALAVEDKARWQREDKAYKAGGGAAAPKGDADMADAASASDAEADDEADE
jgi:structure-specific recognition protein 1